MMPVFRTRRTQAVNGALLLALMAAHARAGAQAQPVTLHVRPSTADPRITAADSAHLVKYTPGKDGAPLLLFLPGTNGFPREMEFHDTALDLGYRVISLAYITKVAVAAVCTGERLAADPNCAAHFRQQRIYGDAPTRVIGDQPQDAIVSRLTTLLRYLVRSDTAGHWGQYLDDDKPRWNRIAVSGQSQGGGMAEFIGQRELVARVISFSGGWDYSAPGKIANWYSSKGVTPPDRWFATYHVEEPTAGAMAEICNALGIPRAHQFALHEPVRAGKTAHGEGLNNTAYRNIWITMLGFTPPASGRTAPGPD